MFYLSDSPKRAEELAKMVTVEYGEPTGPPVLTTKDAVSKEAFFDQPQATMTSGDARSELLTDTYKAFFTAFLNLSGASSSVFFRQRVSLHSIVRERKIIRKKVSKLHCACHT